MEKAANASATTSKSGKASPEAPVFIEEIAEVTINREIVTGMKPEFYNAAVEGNINAFMEMGKEIEFILTPQKNTILHIHFTNYTVNEAFVERILCKCPVLVMKANAKGETILHAAARYGHFEIVRKIIEHANALPKDIDNEVGAEKKLIRAINDKKDTALHEAVRYHHPQVVEFLIKEDSDHPYFGNNDDETPLYIAAEREYWDVVNIILENSNSPNHNGPSGRTVLHAAIIRNNKEIVSKLWTRTLARQADENGWVPLHLAALHRHHDLAEELLRCDRNTAYMRDNKGRTALHFAAFGGQMTVMEKIIKYCPDCSELVDEKGCNALHYIMASENRPLDSSAMRMILERESLSNLYNEKDDEGNTPLHYLAAPWNFSPRHLLLESQHQRVDKMAFNKQNQTVLDVAYDNRTQPSATDEENLFLRKLKEGGARYGGRVINKDAKKKKQEKRQESAVYKNKKKEEKDEPDPIDRVRETISVVATLIATVTFAAGFTLPGGTTQEGEHQGSPILKHNAAFIAFDVADSISFVLSASAVLFQIFSALFSEKLFGMYGRLVMVAFWLTMLAMVFMIIAFATGTYAVLGASKGLGVVTLLIGLSFFFTFSLFFRMLTKPRRSFLEDPVRYYPERSFSAAEEIQLADI